MPNTFFESTYGQLVGITLVILITLGAFGLIQQQIKDNYNANLLTQATNQLTQSQLAASGGIDLSQFSGPISNVSTENNTISIEDTLIYETGYRLTTDGQWQTFNLSGNAQTAAWYTGQAQATLPDSTAHALIFSCSWESGWNCHDGWQHFVIDSSADSDDGDDEQVDGSNQAITVRARGKDGTESLSLQLNNQTVISWGVSTDFQTYSYTPNTSEAANIKVSFGNDKGVGHDLIVDYVQVGDTRLQAEDQQTNTAVYQNGSCGGSYSENMQCSGFIDFGTHSLTGGDDTGSDSDDEAQSGTINVSLDTDGPGPYPDNYTVNVADQTKQVTPQTSTTFTGLSSGEYTIELTGIPDNCSVGSRWQQVSLSSTDTVSRSYRVYCYNTNSDSNTGSDNEDDSDSDSTDGSDDTGGSSNDGSDTNDDTSEDTGDEQTSSGDFDSGDDYEYSGGDGEVEDSLLPQDTQWQQALYDWLETIEVSDVQLESKEFTYKGHEDSAHRAEQFIKLHGATVSSVVRGAPEWYVLDAGNGKGIEATGEVRVWHEPEGPGDYPGNPPRSWANEPAYLYQMDVKNPDGTQVNPYYQDETLCRRAMVVASTDMMMYRAQLDTQNYGDWGDMYGKAMLSWAEAYRWCKEEIPETTRQAFEAGFSDFLDEMVNGHNSPRAVNTNMDMFAIHAAADFYRATDDQSLREKAVMAVRDWLFGYTDGELGSKHKVFAVNDRTGGVFDPSGFIMEGDQPDIFYGGESIYHIVGALSAVTDRSTGNVADDWQFLDEVARRLQEWRSYQLFFDPGKYNEHQGGLKDENLYIAGAGFSGRTGAGVPAGQSGEIWKYVTKADYFDTAKFKLKKNYDWNNQWRWSNKIEDKISALNDRMSETYDGQPDTWNGWSPWAKKTPYLPQEGWYERLSSLSESEMNSPPEQSGSEFNKAFGGYPVGGEYWAYKDNGNGDPFGWFIEAQAKQGQYGGWYGGKIETFWTKDTGVVLANRHGKGGCDIDGPNDDEGFEDSVCWWNIDSKAGHHVWGRDEDDDAFTTLKLRGRDLERTSDFALNQSTPTVSVENIFNDPSQPDGGGDGEQGSDTLEGDFSVTNTFAAVSNGLRVTHEVESDGTDELNSLWATLPVFLKAQRQDSWGPQMSYEKTSIEYWDGSSWQAMPEDADNDGTPEMVDTTRLRLGRDFQFGDGMQYVYVDFDSSRDVRLAKRVYSDPYQTRQMFRSVHIDLHGSPGNAKTLSESSVTYDIVTDL